MGGSSIKETPMSKEKPSKEKPSKQKLSKLTPTDAQKAQAERFRKRIASGGGPATPAEFTEKAAAELAASKQQQQQRKK
jgi:hypothetical protein